MTEPFEPAAPSPAADQPAQPATEPAAAPAPSLSPAPADDDTTQPVSYSPAAERRPAWTVGATETDAENVAPPTPIGPPQPPIGPPRDGTM